MRWFRVNGQNGQHGTAGTSKKVTVLSFHHGRFVLQGVHIAPREWTKSTPTSFWTKNIQAAARFRSHADSATERLFKKVMLKSFDLPAGGVLSPPHLELYPFQSNFGVPHILANSKSYLAHQPGLGKSAQAICAVNSKPGRALIIAPSFLTTTWAREITKWSLKDFPTIEIVPATSKRMDMTWKADFTIVSDAMLIKDWVRKGLAAQDFRFVFIDEGHRFKTPDASRTVALFGGSNGKLKSPGFIYRSEHVCILSGTPLLNRPIELWPMLYAMAPELIDFMSYEDFGYRYGGAVLDERGHWRFVGSANESELKNRIMGRFMQRIRKVDVLKDLPNKIREAVVVDTDTREADVKALDKKLMRELSKSQFEKPEALGDYARVRHENGLAKINWAAQFVNDILAADGEEQILLFAHHRDVVEGLSAALKVWYPAIINGGVKQTARTDIEDDFQAGRCRLIIGNIDAMNLGLTLTAATRVVFAEYSWTPALNEQAEDRAHRIGQKDSVFCQYLVLPGSIDEAILNTTMVKELSISKVLD